MKFDSPHFDRIRVKPSDDRRIRPGCQACDWPGCKEEAVHRAPKGRLREREYWRFCLAHVREYNASYNFFAGMSEDAVARYQKDSITGHRPTWKMGVGKRGVEDGTDGAADPFGMFHEFGARAGRPDFEPRQQEQRTIRNAERKALDTLGLDVTATIADVKRSFKDLVKKHHPDANGGDRSSEDRLREIIQAYKYLKSAGYR
jgi:hypothetical protein